MGRIYLHVLHTHLGVPRRITPRAVPAADVHHNQLQQQPDALPDYNDCHGDVQRHTELAFVPRAGECESAGRLA
jgi:hypothetical protein